MNILYLPNGKNKSELEFAISFTDLLREKGYITSYLEYVFNSGNMNYEENLNSIEASYDIVIAKEMEGSVLALKGIEREVLFPQLCVFIDFPQPYEIVEYCEDFLVTLDKGNFPRSLFVNSKNSSFSPIELNSFLSELSFSFSLGKIGGLKPLEVFKVVDEYLGQVDDKSL